MVSSNNNINKGHFQRRISFRKENSIVDVWLGPTDVSDFIQQLKHWISKINSFSSKLWSFKNAEISNLTIKY